MFPVLWVGLSVVVGIFASLAIFTFCNCCNCCNRSSRNTASGTPAQSISTVHQGQGEAVNRGYEDTDEVNRGYEETEAVNGGCEETDEVNQLAYESDLSDVRDGPPVYRQLFPEGYTPGPQNNNIDNRSREDGSVVGGFTTPTSPPPPEPPPSYGTVMVWGGAGR